MRDAILRKIGRKRVFEGKLLRVARRLVHGEPGRLVQNQDILIFKEHFERHGHGTRARRIRRIANFCREHIAGLHRGRCECAHAVEQDPRFAQLHPADERFGHAQLLRKQAFDRTPGKAFVNGERKRAHRASLERDEHKYSIVGGSEARTILSRLRRQLLQKEPFWLRFSKSPLFERGWQHRRR